MHRGKFSWQFSQVQFCASSPVTFFLHLGHDVYHGSRWLWRKTDTVARTLHESCCPAVAPRCSASTASMVLRTPPPPPPPPDMPPLESCTTPAGPPCVNHALTTGATGWSGWRRTSPSKEVPSERPFHSVRRAILAASTSPGPPAKSCAAWPQTVSSMEWPDSSPSSTVRFVRSLPARLVNWSTSSTRRMAPITSTLLSACLFTRSPMGTRS
mmetsp:Transcript_13821/g.37077  ORF Transcript_13821/g.37077 Transcript_13821/m.37077 type:complete len:212 (-) Transcript_13821:721-1356(-)